MANHELASSIDAAREPPSENLDPGQFYVAYVFDRAETRKHDITTLIGEAQQLGYPVRYWWLSAAMDLQGSPDRLIVCVHHPSTDANAGMDLGDALHEQLVTWDDLEAAAVEEYRDFGQPVETSGSILKPGGSALFPLPAIDRASHERDETGPETTTEFIVYYSLSTLTILSATDEHQARDRVFASLHSLVGKMGAGGLTASEASQVGLSEADVEIELVEPVEPPENKPRKLE